jgi:FHA domain-containing protein
MHEPVSAVSSAGPDARLAEALEALSSTTRLGLLRTIQTRKKLSDIKIHAPAPDDAERDRPLARQTIKQHLEHLIELGFVVAREDGRNVEYVLNHQTIFALSEDLRALARLRPEETPPGKTIQRSPEPSAGRFRPQCLVLVKGLDEGRVFDLSPAHQPPDGWIVGRQPGLPVPLDFDPFVSSLNARIVWREGAHDIEDLAESRNGTTVNFAPLPKGSRRKLEHGDVIGVGRSLLLYRA